MKQVSILFVVLALFSCKQDSDKRTQLEHRIDSLEIKLSNTYKPGFGELMVSIQSHHSKLWFAGQNQNWKLATFEIHELEETLENIITFQTEREESKFIKMIRPNIDSVTTAIEQKDLTQFTSTYSKLTQTCNHCHRLNNHEYIIIKVPKISPFSNQNFKE